MSTQWYFHKFDAATFEKLCGSATLAQKKKFVVAVTDPDEFGEVEEDELEHRAALAKSILEHGVDYTGLSEPEAPELDEIVRLIFNWMGMGKEMGAKPVSPEPLSLTLSEELARVASTLPASLLQLFRYGRRLGQTGQSSCHYIVFDRAESAQLEQDLQVLLADDSIVWDYLDAPKWVRAFVLPPLKKTLKDKKLQLYAVCT